MLFFQKKKIMRDRGHGLVFRWRRARRHQMGKLLALVLTSFVFGVVVYAVKVEGLREPLLTRMTGEVAFLNGDTDYGRDLLLQVENRSPFPARWDPAFDEGTMRRVERGVEELEGPVLAVRSSLLPLPVIHRKAGLPSVTAEQSSYFTGSVDDWQAWSHFDLLATDAVLSDLQIRVKVKADEGLERRLPAGELLLSDQLISDDFYGLSFRFLVGVDSVGVVRGCLPLSGGSMEVSKPTEKQRLLAAWLRRVMFRPQDERSIMIGVIELQIQAERND